MKAVSRDTSQPSLPTATTASTAEDEAAKRNTDCVYFLASPLTCKKGIECEYRHSEEARMNPRDCWYWMHGNCLNPKCSFRHPPLDGLLATGATSLARSSAPPSHAAASVQLPAGPSSVGTTGKQGTPCYYFQNSHCLKGDRCPFMHVPQAVDSLLPQPPVQRVIAPASEPKKFLGGIEKCTQQKKTPLANAIKPVEVLPQAKPPMKTAPTNNGIIERTVPSIALLNKDLPRYKPTQVPPVISGSSLSRNQPSRQTQPLDDRNFRNGKEPGEFLGESSPGFDVLVDDELEDSDYYQNEDELRRMTSHGGKPLNAVNEFEYGRSADYNSLGKYDREAYNEPRSYDRYGRDQDLYALEQRRVSSERISERSSITERRGRPRAESPDHVDESDLRYRLSKQRRVNGSRTGVSPDRREDFYRRDDRGRHVEDQRYRSHSRRDSRPLPPPESSISTRLAGRISLRGRSPSDSNHHESYREREVDRGRNWARLSPGRPLSSNYRGTSQDRIKRRVQEDFPADVRSFRPLIRRDDSDNETSDFAAPKRLSELKGSKGSESSEERQIRGSQILSSDGKSMRSGKLGQELEGSSSFEGPKPLSEILKRKREEKGVAFGDDMVSGNKNGNGEDQISVKTSERKVEADDQAPSIKEEEEEEGLISEENAELTNEDQPSVPKGNEVETDDMIDKMEEDQDFEAYDQGDEEYEYDEQGDDGGDENADPDDEYVDDEDDFAKKIGVMFS